MCCRRRLSALCLYSRWYDTFLPGRQTTFGPETFGVHLWHELWRRARLDEDENYGPRSLYEVLKLRYGISAVDDAGALLGDPSI
jgi:hypothetical protein